jgi:hypothetical protein
MAEDKQDDAQEDLANANDILAFINERLGDDFRCDLCARTDWTLIFDGDKGATAALLFLPRFKPSLTGSTVRYFACLSCTNCGNTKLLNLGPVEAWKRGRTNDGQDRDR